MLMSACLFRSGLIISLYSWIPIALKGRWRPNFPTHRFFWLATQKGNNLLLPKRQKNWGSPTSFWGEHAPKNILNLKNRASLADKASVCQCLAVTIWHDPMSLGQKSCIFFNFKRSVFVHFWTMCRPLSIKSISGKKNRGHRISKIVKSTQSYCNGHLPYHFLFYFLGCALDAWRGEWICVRSSDAQWQWARTSLKDLLFPHDPNLAKKLLCLVGTVLKRGRCSSLSAIGYLIDTEKISESVRWFTEKYFYHARIPRKYNLQVGYFMIHSMKALHN